MPVFTSLQIDKISTISLGSRDYQIYIAESNYQIYRLFLQVYKLTKYQQYRLALEIIRYISQCLTIRYIACFYKLTHYQHYRLVLETIRYILQCLSNISPVFTRLQINKILTTSLGSRDYQIYIAESNYQIWPVFTSLQIKKILTISLDSRDYQIYYIAVSNYQIYLLFLQLDPLSTLSTGSRDYQIYISQCLTIRYISCIYKFTNWHIDNIAWF